MKVLFVCSGNICRSPMAEAYFRQRAAAGGLSHVVIDSAGTLGIYGRPAAPAAVEALREIGIDLSGHRSKGLRASDLRTSDLVIVMARDHLDELALRFPAGDDQRLMVRAFEDGPSVDPNPVDLDDPIGEPAEVFRQQLKILQPCLDHLVLHLKHRR